MKIVLLMGLFLGVLFFLIFLKSSPQKLHIAMTQTATPPTENSGYLLHIANSDFLAVTQKIAPAGLTLLTNFNKQLNTTELMSNNHCRYGTSAGFYTKNSQPLGIFYTNGQFISKTVHDQSLFNGFLYKTTEGQLVLSRTVPNFEQLDFLFQSGPLFTPDQKLTIVGDEMARRIIIGETTAHEWYFIALTQPDNGNSGPYLADIPELITQLPQKFMQLLNLDGGAASAFYGVDGTKRQELTPVGSFLCGQ